MNTAPDRFPRSETASILNEVQRQRERDFESGYDAPGIHQDGFYSSRFWAGAAQRQLNRNANTLPAHTTWRDLLDADWALLNATTDPYDTRARAIEMLATLVAMVDDIDRRQWANVISQKELASLEGEADPRRSMMSQYVLRPKREMPVYV